MAVVVWAEEEHEPVGDDVGDEKGAGVSDECKANAEGRRMSRAAEISLMIEDVGEQNGLSGLREEGMLELRCYSKEMTNRR